MHYKLCVIILLLITNSIFSQTEEKITVGPGPEDFVLDTFFNQERLIISCDPRREKDSALEGDIWSYEIETEQTLKLNRQNEPVRLSFNPHGIYLLKEKDSLYLFVVNHYNMHKESEILRYLVKSNDIYYQKSFPYRSTINSVVAVAKNEFYITNDKKVNGNLAHYKNSEYNTIDNHIYYPNGINIKDSVLYLSTTLSNKIYTYNLNDSSIYTQTKQIAKVKGADNIRFYNNFLITSSHPKLMRVVKHFKNAEKTSPSVIYAINLYTGEKKELYSNDGSNISAASGAIYYKNHLYIAQIFENFILKVKADL
jgi:hypothetical protein